MSIETPDINLTTEIKEELSGDGITSIDSRSRLSSMDSGSSGRNDVIIQGFIFSDVHDAEFEHDGNERKETNITVGTEEVPCSSDDLFGFLLMLLNEIRRSRGWAELPRLSSGTQLGWHVPDFADNLIHSVDAYCLLSGKTEVYYVAEPEIDQLEDIVIEPSETSVIEPSETLITTEWSCPKIDYDDLGPMAMDSAVLAGSHGCNDIHSTTTEEIVLKRDKEVADESFCFESFYPVSESVFPIVKDKKLIIEDESVESSPLCRSESIHSKAEGGLTPIASLLNSFDDNIPAIEINPMEELPYEDNHHVPSMPAKAHKKSRFNWIRRLFCFTA
jgi:hypothetical protein